jgi:hypothetical protein
MASIGAALVAVVLSATPGGPAQAILAGEVLAVESDEPHGSTSFKDTSPRGHRVERSGDTHHSSKEKKAGRSSIYFDGDGDYLSVEDSPVFSFGVDNFVLEFWFRPEGAGRRFICGQAPRDGASVRSSIGVAIEADGRLRAGAQSTRRTYLLYAAEEAYLDGDWHHVSFRREDDLLRLFVDGKEHAQARIGQEPVNDSEEPFSIGRSGRFPTDPYRGYLDTFIIRRPRRVWHF